MNASANKFRFSPIVDGWYLPKSADEIFAAGEQSDVSTITGFVADEGSYNNDYGKMSAENFKTRVKMQAGKFADEILKLYPSATKTECSESQKMLSRDLTMVSLYMWTMKRKKTAKTNIYTYIFTHQEPGATKEKYLAFHSSELPYVFDNLNQSPRPWKDVDKKIAEYMSAYWINFITSGDPNAEGLPKWPAVNENPEETMELGDKMEPRLITSREKFELLKKLMQN